MTPVQVMRLGPYLEAEAVAFQRLYIGVLQCCTSGISSKNETHGDAPRYDICTSS